MTTILNLPLQQAYPETIKDLQERFPTALMRVEIREKDMSKILTEQRFWEIINLFDWADAEDDDRVLEPAINALTASPVHHIYLFADMLADKLFSLDQKSLLKISVMMPILLTNISRRIIFYMLVVASLLMVKKPTKVS